MRSQRRFPNKADLLFCSSLQGCNSLLGFLHPSIPVFILPFSSSFSKLLSSRAKCANAIRRHLPCRFCASINLPDRVGCCCCCPGKVSSLGTCFHLKLTTKKKKQNTLQNVLYKDNHSLVAPYAREQINTANMHSSNNLYRPIFPLEDFKYLAQ